MLGFERALWDYGKCLALAILDIASLTTTIFVLGRPGRTAIARKHPDAEAVNTVGWVGFTAVVPLCDSHPVTEIANPRHSKANWLDSRGVFHADVRRVTKRQPASELAVAIREVFEGHIFLSRRE